jgi:hypothetical protein
MHQIMDACVLLGHDWSHESQRDDPRDRVTCTAMLDLSVVAKSLHYPIE